MLFLGTVLEFYRCLAISRLSLGPPVWLLIRVIFAFSAGTRPIGPAFATHGSTPSHISGTPGDPVSWFELIGHYHIIVIAGAYYGEVRRVVD
jgi:hypothetical protein